MASNITPTWSTKHVNIRYKYVNKYVEDRVVKIIFVKYADNVGNILTKSFQSFTRRIQRRWWVRSLEMLIASKIFEVD